MAKQQRPYSSINEQIGDIRGAGFLPAAIVVDKVTYTQLLEDIARDNGLDYLDAISALDGIPIAIVSVACICEVVVDAQQQWDAGDDLKGAIDPESVPRETVFAEL
ncbi:MAG TPA: hypothetical protein VGK19_12245 [Capsulimonadaceae bacterium]